MDENKPESPSSPSGGRSAINEPNGNGWMVLPREAFDAFVEARETPKKPTAALVKLMRPAITSPDVLREALRVVWGFDAEDAPFTLNDRARLFAELAAALHPASDGAGVADFGVEFRNELADFIRNYAIKKFPGGFDYPPAQLAECRLFASVEVALRALPPKPAADLPPDWKQDQAETTRIKPKPAAEPQSEGERLHETYDGNGRRRDSGGFCS